MKSDLITQTRLPRWRGFNLTEMIRPESAKPYQEADFAWMSDWGFDFVRLPVSYRCFVEEGDLYTLKESALEKLDLAIAWGKKHRIHVNLNLHRAPGYCVYYGKGPGEPFNLWKDKEAQDAFRYYWETFARRYREIDSTHLSFNLVNEPHEPGDSMTRDDHARVIRSVVTAIEEIDAHRLIVIDGLREGTVPCPELADTGVSQSCRAYYPYGVSHYQAEWAREWVNWDEVPAPSWPGGWNFGELWGKEQLHSFYRPWLELAQGGTGVMCGEGGAYKYTPHPVALAWLEEVFSLFREHNIGWALWNFRGPFGILDSERNDIRYEDWHGHSLDRRLLDLLRNM